MTVAEVSLLEPEIEGDTFLLTDVSFDSDLAAVGIVAYFGLFLAKLLPVLPLAEPEVVDNEPEVAVDVLEPELGVDCV